MPLPQDPIRRRRLAALGVVGAAALLGGAWAGAGARDDERTERPAAQERGARQRARTTVGPGSAPSPDPSAGRSGGDASTERLFREVGRTIVLRFAGTSVPGYVRRALRERRAAGVILFRDNVVAPAQVRAMTRAIQRAAQGRALVMIDQEGGEIRNIPWGAPSVTPPQLTTAGDARAVALATARDLRAVGVNVNLAPVADVGTWPGSVMRGRAFPGDGRAVGALVAATVGGYRDGGVLATAKHFPGLGRSEINTDKAPATVAGEGDLEPFAAAVAADVPLVMAGHALHPDLDPERIASQSSRVLRGLLRDRLGFEGACITDSLEAQAVVRRSSTPVAALRSMRAGCDLLLTTGRGSYIHVMRLLVENARSDPSLRARLAEARRRIDGLLPGGS